MKIPCLTINCPKLKFAEIRPNILIIAGLIFLVCMGIVALIGIAILNATTGKAGDSSTTAFVIGALIGLLGAGLTGLAGLGTTLVTEKPSNDQDKSQSGSP